MLFGCGERPPAEIIENILHTASNNGIPANLKAITADIRACFECAYLSYADLQGD